MAINKKLITFDKKSTFLGANGINNVSSPTDGYYHNIPEWSMVFILETGEIWHNGKYFGKPIKDQIFPATSQLTKGIVFMNNDDYYYRSFNLWGNVFDGSVRDINGELVVQGETYKWTYGDGVIRKGNANLIAFSGLSNVYDVFIPSGNLSVTGGDLKVGNNITLSSTGSIKGTHILNTNSYFNLDYSLGKTWNSIKLFNTSGTLISLDSTRPAIINIQAGVYASGTNWQPWITGGDVTELSSWGIGLGGDAFYIGRISKSNTENSLSQYWKFDSEDGITISGTTKYIKVADLAGASEKIFLADGTVKALSELMSDAVVGEATTTNYGGFKLTQNKSSVQQTLVSNTTGNGRYAVKMNADGTLFVEFVLANTWLPVTNTQGGYVPQLSGENDAIGSSLNDYVLTFTSSDAETIYPTWRRLPSNAFDNTWRGIYVDNTSKLGTGTTTKPINFKAGTGIALTFTAAGNNAYNTLQIDGTTYSTATDSALGLVKVGTTLDDVTGFTAVHIKDGKIYYKDTTYSFSNLKFQLTSGTDLMTYDSQSARTILAGNNITFEYSNNILTIKATDTWTKFVGATDNSNGTAGYLDAPGKSNKNNFLRGDGTWLSLESNVTSALYVGASNGTSTTAQSTNGSVYLIFKEGSSYSRYQITGSGRASVTSDSSGNITINSNGYSNFTAATANAAGNAGLVPGPAANQLGSGGYYLKADGTWGIPTNTWKEVSTSQEGYVPKIITTGSLTSSDNPFILVYKNVSGTTKSVWVPLPANAFNNTWTAADFTNAGYVPKSVKGKFLHAKSDTGALEWVDDNNTWDAASTSKAGYVPKLATGGGTIASSDTAYVLAYKSGVAGTTAPVWILLPSNAYNDTWNAMTGATASANGTVGYVNATPPKDGYNTKFLRADGTWSVPAYPTKDSWNYDDRYLSLSSGGTVSGNITANSFIKSNSSDSCVLLAGGGDKNLDTILCDIVMKSYNTPLGTVNHFSNSITGGMTDRDLANNGYKWTHTAGTDGTKRISDMHFDGYSGPITVSFYVKADTAVNDASIDVVDRGCSTTWGETSFNITTSYTYHKFTILSADRYNTVGNYNGFLDMNIPGNISNTYYIKNIKVEKGLVATDWCLSPWDIANGIGPEGMTTKVDILKTARTLTIGSSGKSFDGSADVSWSLSDIGISSWAQSSTKPTYNLDEVSDGTNRKLSNYVTLDTAQSITGTKDFIRSIKIRTTSACNYPTLYFHEYYNGTNDWVGYIATDYYGSSLCNTTGYTHGMYFKTGRDGYTRFIFLNEDSTPVAKLESDMFTMYDGSITANSFVKVGGTAALFLKADGSIDTNTYSTTSHDHDGRYLRDVSHNTEWTEVANMPTNFVAGLHRIHVYNREYSSVLTGYDYYGSYWQLWFHPASGYTEDIQYRATNCTTWKTILDSNNSSVSLSGSTLTVKINGNSQSLTNTWRGITDSYSGTSDSTSLSLKGAKALYDALVNGNANTFNSLTSDYYRTCGMRNLIARDVYTAGVAGFRWTPGRVLHTTSGYTRLTFSKGLGSYSSDPYRSEGPYGYYSISFWYKVENYVSGNTINVNINDCNCGDFSINGNRGWTFWTGTCKERTDSARYGFVDFENTNNAKVTISDIVIVRGTNLSLTWFPAPEDLCDLYSNLTISGSKTFSSKITGTITNADSATSAGSATTATSAGKLTSAVSIWGQSFDGSASISGDMTFAGKNNVSYNYYIKNQSYFGLYFKSGLSSDVGIIFSDYGRIGIGKTDPAYSIDTTGDVKANSFIKIDGTSSLFLKADGSVDSSSYATTSSVMKYYTLNYGASINSSKNIGFNLDPGNAKIHISNVEYSAVLTLHNYVGKAIQIRGIDNGLLYYRTETGGSDWRSILDSNNSSVSKSGETLTVKINGSSESLSNTWRGIQNNLTSDSTTDSLSAALGKALNTKFGNYVTLATDQTITGVKRFEASYFRWSNNDAVLDIYGRPTCCGNENVAIQSTFDNRSPKDDDSYPTSMPDRAAILLQPKGGYVGIGIANNPSYTLHVNGNAAASNFYTTSDRTKKQNISSFSEHIRKFQLKDTEKWHYGVIAQEVEEMFRDGEEGNMTVNYNSVLSYYVGQLENRVKELEDKLKKYEDKIIN